MCQSMRVSMIVYSSRKSLNIWTSVLNVSHLSEKLMRVGPRLQRLFIGRRLQI